MTSAPTIEPEVPITATAGADPWVVQAVDLAIAALRENLGETGYDDPAAFEAFVARKKAELFRSPTLVREVRALRLRCATYARDRLLADYDKVRVTLPPHLGVSEQVIVWQLDMVANTDPAGDLGDPNQSAATWRPDSGTLPPHFRSLPVYTKFLMGLWDKAAPSLARFKQAPTRPKPPRVVQGAAGQKPKPPTPRPAPTKTKAATAQEYDAVQEAILIGKRCNAFLDRYQRGDAPSRETARNMWWELNDNLMGWTLVHGDPRVGKSAGNIAKAIAGAQAQAKKEDRAAAERQAKWYGSLTWPDVVRGGFRYPHPDRPPIATLMEQTVEALHTFQRAFAEVVPTTDAPGSTTAQLVAPFVTMPPALLTYPGPWTPGKARDGAAWLYRAHGCLRLRPFVRQWAAQSGQGHTEVLQELAQMPVTDEAGMLVESDVAARDRWRFDLCAASQGKGIDKLDLLVPHWRYFSGPLKQKRDNLKDLVDRIGDDVPDDDVGRWLLMTAKAQVNEASNQLKEVSWRGVLQNLDPRDTYIPLDVLTAWANTLQVSSNARFVESIYYGRKGRNRSGTTLSANVAASWAVDYDKVRQTDRLNHGNPNRLDLWNSIDFPVEAVKDESGEQRVGGKDKLPLWSVPTISEFNEYDDWLEPVGRYLPRQLRFVKLPLYTTVALLRQHEIAKGDTPQKIADLYGMTLEELGALNGGIRRTTRALSRSKLPGFPGGKARARIRRNRIVIDGAPDFTPGSMLKVWATVPYNALKSHDSWGETYKPSVSERIRLLLGWLNNEYSTFKPNPFVKEDALEALYGPDWESVRWDAGWPTVASAVGSENVIAQGSRQWTMKDLQVLCAVPQKVNNDYQALLPHLQLLFNSNVGSDAIHGYAAAAGKKIRDIRTDERREAYAAAFTRSFTDWLSKSANEPRRQAVRAAYNERWASYIVPEYASTDEDGHFAYEADEVVTRDLVRVTRSMKPPAGYVPGDVLPTGTMVPFPYQSEAARRLVAEGGGLLAFGVGIGKTFTALMAMGQARQEGKAKRCVIAVPRGILRQWLQHVRNTFPDYRVTIIGTRYVPPGPGDLNRGRLSQEVAKVQDRLGVPIKSRINKEAAAGKVVMRSRWLPKNWKAVAFKKEAPAKDKKGKPILYPYTLDKASMGAVKAARASGDAAAIVDANRIFGEMLDEAMQRLAYQEASALVLKGTAWWQKRLGIKDGVIVGFNHETKTEISTVLVPEPERVSKPDDSARRGRKWADFKRGRYDVAIVSHDTLAKTTAFDEQRVQAHILESPPLLRTIEKKLYDAPKVGWDPNAKNPNTKRKTGWLVPIKTPARSLLEKLTRAIKGLNTGIVLSLTTPLAPPQTYTLEVGNRVKKGKTSLARVRLYDSSNRPVSLRGNEVLWGDVSQTTQAAQLPALTGTHTFRGFIHAAKTHRGYDVVKRRSEESRTGVTKEVAEFLPNPIFLMDKAGIHYSDYNPLRVPVLVPQRVYVKSLYSLFRARHLASTAFPSGQFHKAVYSDIGDPTIAAWRGEYIVITSYGRDSTGEYIGALRFPQGLKGSFPLIEGTINGLPATGTIAAGEHLRGFTKALAPEGMTLEQWAAKLERELTDPRAPFRIRAARQWVAEQLKPDRNAVDSATSAILRHVFLAPQLATVVDRYNKPVVLGGTGLDLLLGKLGVPTGDDAVGLFHADVLGQRTIMQQDGEFGGVRFVENLQQLHPDGVPAPFPWKKPQVEKGARNGAYFPYLYPTDTSVIAATSRRAVQSDLDGTKYADTPEPTEIGVAVPVGVEKNPLRPGQQLLYAEYAAAVLAEILNDPAKAGTVRLPPSERESFFRQMASLHTSQPGPYRVVWEETAGVGPRKGQAVPKNIRNYNGVMKAGKKSKPERTPQPDRPVFNAKSAGVIAQQLAAIPAKYDVDPSSGKEIVWDELGVDFLVIDEVHKKFKNLHTPGGRGSLGGGGIEFLSLTGESKSAWKVEFRTAAVRANNGRVVLLTATPATTSPIEFYNILSYLGEPGKPDETVFTQVGIRDPEEFVSRYVVIEDAIVAKPGGEPQERKIARRIKNVNEFKLIFDRYANRKTADDSPLLRGEEIATGWDGRWKTVQLAGQQERGVFMGGTTHKGALERIEVGDRLRIVEGPSQGDYQIYTLPSEQHPYFQLQQVVRTPAWTDDEAQSYTTKADRPRPWAVYRAPRVPVAPPTIRALVGLDPVQLDRYAGYQQIMGTKEARGMGSLLHPMSRTATHLGLELLTEKVKGGFKLEIPEEEREALKRREKESENERFVTAFRMALPRGSDARRITPFGEQMGFQAELVEAIMIGKGKGATDGRTDELRLRVVKVRQPDGSVEERPMLEAPYNDSPEANPTGTRLPVVMADPYLTARPDTTYVELVLPYRPGKKGTIRPNQIVLWRTALTARAVQEIIDEAKGAWSEAVKAAPLGTLPPAKLQPYYVVNGLLADACLPGARGAYDPSDPAGQAKALRFIEVEALRRLDAKGFNMARMRTFGVPEDLIEEAKANPLTEQPFEGVLKPVFTGGIPGR